MAEPITWRNVGGTVGGGTAGLLAMGQQQVNQGLDAISKLFRSNAAQDERNFLRVRENNTAQYLDAVASAGGVDALQDPATRQGLEALRAGFGAAIDREATRGAVDTRIAGLQRQAAATAEFEDMNTERAQRGLIDQGIALASAGNMDGVRQLLAENQFLNEGKLANELFGIVDAGTRRQYAAEDQARQNRSEQRQIAQFKETMAAAAENRVIRNEARRDAKEERDFRRNSRVLDDAATKAQGILSAKLANNEWANTSTDPAKDATTILKGMVDKNGNSVSDSWLGSNADDRRQMTQTVTKLLSEGVEVDGVKYKVPPALIQQELAASGGDWFIRTNGASKSLEEFFKNSFTGNAGAVNRAKALEAQEIKANAREFINTLNKAKVQIGTSSSLDTSGIVAGLAALANPSGAAAAGLAPALMPERGEDDKLR